MRSVLGTVGPRRWAAVVGLFVAVVVVVAAAAAVVVLLLPGAGQRGSQLADATVSPKPSLVRTPVLAVAGSLTARTVAWDRPLTLRVVRGSLSRASVVDAAGHPVPGQLGADHRTWTSAAQLVPSQSYQVRVTMLRVDGKLLRQHVQLTTTAPARVVTTSVSPLDGSLVGVAAPVVVVFSRSVDDKAAAERALTMQMSQPVVGAWHWFDDNEVHFRPRTYWPAGERVTLDVHLAGLRVSTDSWGVKDRTVSFRVGDAHVSTVDVATHSMSVTDNGSVVKVVPVSTGRDKYPTRGGVHIVLEKQAERIMDSATVGIPKGNPDYYYEKVLWDVRVSNGGAFVHAAPWSVSDQGHRDVSHGCVNVSTPNAEWFYHFSRYGDVVNITHAAVGPTYSDAGMMDWNYTWSTWLKDSATGER